MFAFREIERQVLDLLCPECGTCSLSLHLRCDLADRECLTLATCAFCGRQYGAEDLRTYGALTRSLLERMRGEACPVCGQGRRAVRSYCDRAEKRCHFLLICEACGDVRRA